MRRGNTNINELNRIIISDEDIKCLHNTVSRKSNSAYGHIKSVENIKAQISSYEQMIELISIDTLKTMQLLGSNYKVAIGDH